MNLCLRFCAVDAGDEMTFDNDEQVKWGKL